MTNTYIILGERNTGKTTLIKNLTINKNVHYFTFLDFNKDLIKFIKPSTEAIIIEEACDTDIDLLKYLISAVEISIKRKGKTPLVKNRPDLYISSSTLEKSDFMQHRSITFIELSKY
jgi:AAA+ ATPase superfamily predicted ATPase